MLKMKKCWHHLLQVDVIGFFVTRKCQKIQNIDENRWLWLIFAEKVFISSERPEKIQWNF